MNEKLNMILDNQCMIMGMILKLDEEQEKFDEEDITMFEMQLKKIKKVKDAILGENDG